MSRHKATRSCVSALRLIVLGSKNVSVLGTVCASESITLQQREHKIHVKHISSQRPDFPLFFCTVAIAAFEAVFDDEDDCQGLSDEVNYCILGLPRGNYLLVHPDLPWLVKDFDNDV